MIGFARAPGRVNLIGEHIDYNGGTVLPAALSIGIEVELEPRSDTVVQISTDQHDEPAVRDLADEARGDWTDASLGALREAQTLGLIQGGANLQIRSDIPQGAGLSSSAALIVAILKAARAAAAAAAAPAPSDKDIALAARRVENEYLGVPCGIMDQFAVAIATPGTAIALNTKTLDYSLTDLPASHTFVVIHSGVSRKLTDGRYKMRKIECDEAKAHFETDDLCNLDPETIATSMLPEPIRKRAKHCVTEHRRVLSVVEALKAGDIEAVGAMMNESHASMRDDFEMSLPSIDALVAYAVRTGAVGARLTGGGFGGCITALVANDEKDAWMSGLLDLHREAKFICEA